MIFTFILFIFIINVFFAAEEEEWVEEDHTGDIQDALNCSNNDDVETQEETNKNEMTDEEQDLEGKCEGNKNKSLIYFKILL